MIGRGFRPPARRGGEPDWLDRFIGDCFWALPLSILIVQGRDPTRGGVWSALVVVGVVGGMVVAQRRPFSGFTLALGFELAACAAGAAPNLAIGGLIVCAARLIKPRSTWRKGTRRDPITLLWAAAGVATLAFLPHLLDWPSSPVFRGAASHVDAGETFYVLFFAAIVKSDFNLAELIGREAEQKAETDKTEALAAERARIARELHDVVAHQMSVVVAQAQGAEAVVDQDPDRVKAALTTISTTTRDALVELRRLLGVTRPAGATGPAADPEGPQPGLGIDDLGRLATTAEAAGLQVAMHVDLDGPVAAGIALSAHRTIQEALTNAAKHAPGSAVSVNVAATDGTLEISVVNGAATGPATELAGSGVGLIGMRERLDLLGGTLDTGPTPDGGWSVTATFPTLEAPTTNE